MDPLTRKVFVHSFTTLLGAEEAAHLRDAFEEPHVPIDPSVMSEDGRAVYRLLAAPDHVTACATLRQLPATIRGRLDALSPMRYLDDIHAPLVILMHDRDDPMIPVGESRRLSTAHSRRGGAHYTEFTVFKHLDPTRGKPSLLPLAWELGRFYRAIYPMFRRIVA